METKTTLVHDRFQVCCDNGCGMVSAWMTTAEAIKAAQRHIAAGCNMTIVYDVMARKGHHLRFKSPTYNHH